MRVHTLPLLACLAYAPAALAQEPGILHRARTVSGIVLDSVTGRPVASADVRFMRSGRVVFTDRDGRFAAGLEDGGEAVRVRRLGYETTNLSIVVRQGLAPLTIHLAPEPLELPGVTAEARKSRFTLAGVVTDSFTGYPVRSVVVRFEKSGTATLTDANGRFSGRVWPDEEITVDGLGYMQRTVKLPLGPTDRLLRVRVLPDPYVLPNLEIIARTFRRVEKLAFHVVAWDEKALLEHPQPDAMAFLRSEGLSVTHDSNGEIHMTWRASGRGPVLLIDGEPITTELLATQPMTDVYRVIYGQDPFGTGTFVAFYTKTYLRRLGREHEPISIPIGVSTR